MTESQYVNRLTEQARQEGRILASREHLLRLVQGRFPGAIPADVLDLIRRQDSEQMLDEWFSAGVSAQTPDQFLAVVRR